MPVDADVGTRDLGLFSWDVLALSYFLIFLYTTAPIVEYSYTVLQVTLSQT